MKITFYGAARTVTGSMYVLEVGGKKLLLECGIYQGPREESDKRNRELPFDPASIDAMILSHAHLDHSGNIPTLVKKGFKANIYMTPATRDLVGLMLRDSGHIQESDTVFVNKKRRQEGLPPKEPLYTVADAELSLDHFVSLSYEREFYPMPGVKAIFHDAGHILGSAMVELELTEQGKKVKFLFTGDIGRNNLPIIRDPYQARQSDYIMMESTYGDRLHHSLEESVTKLESLVGDVCQRKGKVIIPAFSVGRTQEVVYELHKMFENGTLPRVPIYVDSPLSVNVTAIFKLHPECFDQETRRMVSNHADPFGFGRLTYVTSSDESKKLNQSQEPAIIISASGMCEAGRILHHLKNSIGDPRNAVLIVGFQAEGTLGKKLVDKMPRVRIFGEMHQVKAQVEVLNGFSAHADRNELLDYLAGMDGGTGSILLVHGEEKQTLSFAEELRKRNHRVEVPEPGQSLEL